MSGKKDPAPKPEAPKDRGDPHDRLDRIEELMRRNGWTVD
jgi:hypothetical protein